MLPSPSLFHKFGNRPRKLPDSEPACPKMTHILNISSTVLFSSEKDSISLTLLRNAAELGYPAVYQAMCLRISLTAVYSPLISSSILAWRRMVSQTSAAVFSGVVFLVLSGMHGPESAPGTGAPAFFPVAAPPVSSSERYCAISLKIYGLPLAALPISSPSQPVCSKIALADGPSVMLPFPITGIFTASFTLAMISQSASPI